jgi:hypothetical protein
MIVPQIRDSGTFSSDSDFSEDEDDLHFDEVK